MKPNMLQWRRTISTKNSSYIMSFSLDYAKGPSINQTQDTSTSPN